MDRVGVIEKLIDPKTLRILRLFIQDSGSQFYLREISKESKVPVATCFRIIRKLIKLQLVDLVRIKRFKFYQLAQTEAALYLSELLSSERHAVSEFVRAASKLKQIEAAQIKQRIKNIILKMGIVGACSEYRIGEPSTYSWTKWPDKNVSKVYIDFNIGC